MKTNDGGQAFPHNGMSMRDWFAGMALMGAVCSGYVSESTTEDTAFASYALADAMIEARKK